MELTVQRDVHIQLDLTEEEAHVLSAGLYALLNFSVSEYWNRGERDDSRIESLDQEISTYFDPGALELMRKFSSSGLHAPQVVAAVQELERLRGAAREQDRQHAEDRVRAAESRRKLLARYGLQGMPPETENVLTYLLYVAPRCEGRWVTVQRLLQTYHYCGSANDTMGQKIALVTPHLEFLEQRGRITREEREGRRGWIVPTTKQFRAAYNEPRIVTRRDSLSSAPGPVAQAIAELGG